MEVNNKMRTIFLSLSENEAFARGVVSCFALNLNPSVAELDEIKTAVSEAVTNCIVHGYKKEVGEIILESEIIGDKIHINVFDKGVGIENISKALEPFYSTREEEERSGMGFTIMQTFMDEVKVESKVGEGTSIYMLKTVKSDKKGENA